MNNLIIASTGASGTNYLYEVLKQNQNWEVYHEKLRHKFPVINEKEAQRLINADKVCYINGWAWHHFMNVDCKHKFCIVRNPYDIALSWFNRRKGKLDLEWIDGFNKDLRHLDNCLKHATELIYFESMINVGFENYLRLKFNNVQGFAIKDIGQTKVNSNGREYAEKVSDLPKEFRSYLEDHVYWFKNKYYG